MEETYAQQAEREMWDAATSSDHGPPVVRLDDILGRIAELEHYLRSIGQTSAANNVYALGLSIANDWQRA